MWQLRRAMLTVEVSLALHLGTIGDYWVASATRRLRKLSETIPPPPKGSDRT
jgi:hypothetical protein